MSKLDKPADDCMGALHLASDLKVRALTLDIEEDTNITCRVGLSVVDRWMRR